jgi:polyhydroxyalkanoate synthase
MDEPAMGTTLRPPARTGPRPLPLHLMSALATWIGSSAALPLSRSGWPVWNPALAESARALEAALAGVPPDSWARALDAEVRRRAGELIDGILKYRRHPYRRAAIDPPPVWSEGTTALRDYGVGKAGRPVLVVPSLVNRAYVLDLMEERSFLRFLAARGYRPLLVDWDRPGDLERTFSLTDYVAGRLEAALDAALERAGGPVTVVGYCMGGLLALSLAERRPRDVANLVLLAAPWDFHREAGAMQGMMPAVSHAGSLLIEAMGELPVDYLQSLFFGLDPYLGARKYRAFARLDPDSPEARDFVAVEDWANDGVPLAGAVARDCLFGWYGANTPAGGLWRIAGRPVEPRRVEQPTLVVVPARDRIVPPGSAAALAEVMPNATTLRPPIGHVGMMVARDAERRAWLPIAEWLDVRSAIAAAAPVRRDKRPGARRAGASRPGAGPSGLSPSGLTASGLSASGAASGVLVKSRSKRKRSPKGVPS